MKRFLLSVLFLATLLFLGSNQTLQVANCTHVSKYLAIIVLGSDEFVNASERCYDIISNQWSCAEGSYDILYLSSNLSITPNADKIANKTNLHWALTDWLKNNSNPDAQVWIWIFSHGLGLHHRPPNLLEEDWWLEKTWDGVIEARAEIDSDEGSEITEYLINKNVDGKEGISNTTWVGVDECILLYLPSGKEAVWDDEFKEWLEGVNYRRMVIYMGTCRSTLTSENDTASCYGGGFIDDLSAPRRIIITCTNETYSGWYNSTTGVGWFEEAFMNALDPESPAWDEASNLIDVDYVPSVLEAFIYARSHDMARKAVRVQNGIDPWQGLYFNWREIDESPWLDDGGNFKPSFINGEDVGVGIYGYDSGDGWLARYTWLAKERYSSCVEDVNDDYKVDSTDVYMVAQNYGCFFPGNWSSQCSLVDLNEDDNVDWSDYCPVCAMKTLTDGYFYMPNATISLLKIEMLFDNQNITGDQTGMHAYPDGKVRVDDVLFVALKFGLNEGDESWDYMADINADKKVRVDDTFECSRNFGKNGNYINSTNPQWLSGVTITFSTGEEKLPDSDGFVMIPSGATSFTVKRNGTPIGAMIIFW